MDDGCSICGAPSLFSFTFYDRKEEAFFCYPHWTEFHRRAPWAEEDPRTAEEMKAETAQLRAFIANWKKLEEPKP